MFSSSGEFLVVDISAFLYLFIDFFIFGANPYRFENFNVTYFDVKELIGKFSLIGIFFIFLKLRPLKIKLHGNESQNANILTLFDMSLLQLRISSN